jgi:general nucleoside transport system permease protein
MITPRPRQLALAGIALGALAFWVTLPPIHARQPWWSVALGVAGLAAGLWAVSRGAMRMGLSAVTTAVLGTGLGFLATRASLTNLERVVVWSALLSAMLAWATPLTFAALGGLVSERSGVTNIGLEGMMLAGAFFGVLGSDKLGSWELGLLAAAAGGAGFALLHAFMSIHLNADQIVTGTAINFLALGATGYLLVVEYGTSGSPTAVPQIPEVPLRFLGSGFVGNVLGHLNLMIWLSFLLLVVAYVVLFRTPLGLHIRAVGEYPRAAESAGISVYATRYGAVVLSGVLAALGGAYLSIGFLDTFTENMTQGRGFIALAAVTFGNWRPFGAFAAALLFGGSTALSFRLQQPWGSVSVLFQALPYVLTLIAVTGLVARPVPPAALGRPYVKQ